MLHGQMSERAQGLEVGDVDGNWFHGFDIIAKSAPPRLAAPEKKMVGADGTERTVNVQFDPR